MEFYSLKQACCLMPGIYCEHRRRLSEEEDHAYSNICLAMAQKRTGVRFQGPENLNVKKVMTAVFFDQPMLFYIKRECTCQYSYQEGAFTIGWSFQMPQDEINTYIERVDRRIKHLKMNDRGNQIERELFIHNTLLEMGLRTGPNDWKDHCIIGPLLEGTRNGSCRQKII